MTEQTAPRESLTPSPFDRELERSHGALADRVAILEEHAAREPRDFTSSTGRTVTSDAVLAALDTAHLIHHVVRVRGEERTVVAAFSEEIDALVWQDHLSHEASTQEEPDTYEVEGVHVPTEEELAPFIQQAKDVLRGTDK